MASLKDTDALRSLQHLLGYLEADGAVAWLSAPFQQDFSLVPEVWLPTGELHQVSERFFDHVQSQVKFGPSLRWH